VNDEWSSLPVTNVPRFGSTAVVLPFRKTDPQPPPDEEESLPS